jgi:hypothetical protein
LSDRSTRAVPGAWFRALRHGRSTSTPSQRFRIQAVSLTEQRVEPAHALETAGIGDSRHRQSRFGEQLLCQQKAMGLRQLDRRHTQFRCMARRNCGRSPQLARQSIEPVPVQRAGGDALRRRFGEARNGINARAPGASSGRQRRHGRNPRAQRRGAAEVAPVLSQRSRAGQIGRQ